MNNELLEALNILEQEKNISKDTLLEAIENSLVTACKNHFGKSDNVKVLINPDTCEFQCYQEKTVVEEVEEEPYEPRVLEIEEGDYVSQSKINKFVEKNKDVMDDYLDGYRNPYSQAHWSARYGGHNPCQT